MLLQMYGLGQAFELVTASAAADDEEGLSDDKMPVGDIITGSSQSVVLSAETLTCVRNGCEPAQPVRHTAT